ncbi:MAG: site-specific integrase [Terracidiphilus sp.]
MKSGPNAWVAEVVASPHIPAIARLSEQLPRLGILLASVAVFSSIVYIRLPTKNDSARTVQFHERVRKYLALWLEQRNPNCGHDHLLHSQYSGSRFFTTQTLSAWFKRILRSFPEPACSFHFHRLRHSWATRLMNNGIALMVLKILGGWKSWTSLERYILVLPATIKRQYEQSYAKLQEEQESGTEEAMSLFDYALMDDTEPVTAIDSAA